ncbi:UDP-glycosyltransferase 83A1-like [Neltuma alba]|uniref:UDP-glycosyltransferase 83A1-like n=1 Tax=Neltuma alba TaxID=207710 RepID=UPI0010A4779D|nr:UDP-glycosyltransferase 83A1-like [Prosopis alba]
MSSHRNHVLVLPFPAQGHVNCLMILSNKLAQHGLRITFVNSDFNHRRVVKAMNEEEEAEKKKRKLPVELASISDGMGPEDDRNNVAKLMLAILRTMPSELEKLIEGINGRGDRITCVVADVKMGWALEVSHKLGIKAAVICPTTAAVFALELHMPKLIQHGLMDSNETIHFWIANIKGEFEISPDIPKMNTSDIAWCCIGDLDSQKTIYDYLARTIKASHLTDWWLCNTTFELEPGALSLYPKILPIGPLMESHENLSTRSLGQFWEEDLSCLRWLDLQPSCSVIYVAFGSFTVFDPTQFKELALGLELTQRPFLWVVREDTHGGGTKIAYPDEFEGKKGKIVKWVPQKKVLSHPAIACFVSHCGWNSTMEGLSNGVPFLCWPYFADQFFDKNCICNEWKVGLGFDSDEKGIISRQEIKKKVDMLLEDESIRARSLKLKDIMMNNIKEGGTSMENFRKFLEWVKLLDA